MKTLFLATAITMLAVQSANANPYEACLIEAGPTLGPVITVEQLKQYMGQNPDCAANKMTLKNYADQRVTEMKPHIDRMKNEIDAKTKECKDKRLHGENDFERNTYVDCVNNLVAMVAKFAAMIDRSNTYVMYGVNMEKINGVILEATKAMDAACQNQNDLDVRGHRCGGRAASERKGGR